MELLLTLKRLAFPKVCRGRWVEELVQRQICSLGKAVVVMLGAAIAILVMDQLAIAGAASASTVVVITAQVPRSMSTGGRLVGAAVAHAGSRGDVRSRTSTA